MLNVKDDIRTILESDDPQNCNSWNSIDYSKAERYQFECLKVIVMKRAKRDGIKFGMFERMKAHQSPEFIESYIRRLQADYDRGGYAAVRGGVNPLIKIVGIIIIAVAAWLTFF